MHVFSNYAMVLMFGFSTNDLSTIFKAYYFHNIIVRSLIHSNFFFKKSLRFTIKCDIYVF